jgi:UDP-N-acetyl-D-mannosaminuronic acid dehydrogenase
MWEFDVCVVGGCGHVGLPLSLVFADRGLKVAIHDVNDDAIALVRSGTMPFLERGAQPVLRRALDRGLAVANDPGLASRARHVVVVIGTPVDEHLNPTFHVMKDFFRDLAPHLRDGQCVILRSTVYPGTTRKVHELLRRLGKPVELAFCPERVAEGHAMRELVELPQLVSGCSEGAVRMASDLFGAIAGQVIRMSPEEAEMVKIFANVWRYIQFATANQFFMIATDRGLDYYRVHDALTRDYPRMAGLPRPGFAAGPCLFKDTMQLAAAAEHNFGLGHSAMLINEGLPEFLVKHLKARYPLADMTVGILGMAFKGDSDDPRESLSYKLRKVLDYEAGAVLCTDPFVRGADFLPVDEVLERADLLVLATPHSAYRSLAIPPDKPMVDIWDFFGKGVGLT